MAGLLLVPLAFACVLPSSSALPARLARIAGSSTCSPLEPPAALECVLEEELYPPTDSLALAAAQFLEGGPGAPTGELTTTGMEQLFSAVASLGEPLGASDELAVLYSGVGKLAVQAFLSTDVGRVVGVEPGDGRHRVAAAVGRAALGRGPVAYAVGVNGVVYAQLLSSLVEGYPWEPVGGGPVKSIAVHRGTIYAVKNDSAVYMQSLSLMNLTSEWEMVSAPGVKTITIHGETAYGIGADNCVWTQALAFMSVNSTWTLASRGMVVSVAIWGDTIFGVGTDLTVWKQPLANMTPETWWVPASKGSVERITVHDGTLFAVAYDKRMWKQQLDTMSTESDWVPASHGDIIDAAISPFSFHPTATDAAPLHFVHGDVLDQLPSWKGASVVFLASPLLSDDLSQRLAWALSESLRPGALVFSPRIFPGCWPGLLRVGRSVELATAWATEGDASFHVYAVGPPRVSDPALPQPVWLVPESEGPPNTTTFSQHLRLEAAWAQGSAANALATDNASVCAWYALLASTDAEATMARVANVDLADASGRTLACVSAGAAEEPSAVLGLLAKRGSSLDVRDITGLLPMEHAATAGHASAVGLLLDQRASTGVALHRAALHGHDEVVKVLLEHNASAREMLDAEGKLPLQLASMAREGLRQLLRSSQLEEPQETQQEGGSTAESHEAIPETS